MESLFMSITELKGVGDKRAKLFEKIGITTIYDLLFHFPFRYEDLSVRDINTVMDGEKVTLKGQVITEPNVSYYASRKSRLSFRMSVGYDKIIQVVFFNQPYLMKNFKVGDVIAVYGKWQASHQSIVGMKLFTKKQSSEHGSVYSTTKGLSQNVIKMTIEDAFDKYYDSIPELLPAYYNEAYRLIPLNQALYNMHFPKNNELKRQAQRKIIYLEFFLYQWKLQTASYKAKDQDGVRCMYEVDELRDVINTIPYELTNAQKKAVNDICYDLRAPYPMQRMLQGDVGSGKTIVAFITMLAAVLAGYQTALMAPTEILARQHYESFINVFKGLGYRVVLLVSGISDKERKSILEGIENGDVDIIIGTHALIQDDVIYNNLGYVVIDEQHRFGVKQRQKLLDKYQGDAYCNLLQMTATPIPRSLALTIYGEMSVSTLDEYPKGRKKIQTELITNGDVEYVYKAIEKEVEKGHQAYYVLPLIDESDTLSQVESISSRISALEERFPNYKIGQLHGQMSREEQEVVMEDFTNGKIQILVATTMVEVGVDVPNATVIVIHSAERFGLAQLHQLRGRVGRSNLPSYAYLLAKPTTEEGKKRMKIISEEIDGFVISQEDLKIRGQGNFLGEEQSGLPQFQYANLIEDQKVMDVAREDVKKLLKDPMKISEQELHLLQEWSNMKTVEL